jgi:wyosine [tRNA(Phe)-imidazoG37] synthetase (radical SAM superfamily)
MTQPDLRHVYGPVFSRRLGHSLGIDLVPFKTCTYDCVYCQLGRTTNKTAQRKEYVPVAEILEEVEEKLVAGCAPDFISFAGSGEPTLHERIGDLIAGVKQMTSRPVAVITNGSLLWKKDVQDSLKEADLVVPSLDAGDKNIFQHVNRPCEEITFERMVDGLAEFKRRYSGRMWLEVFLLAGVTGIQSEVEKIAAHCRRIRPERIQLNTLSRPAAEEFVSPVKTDQMEGFKPFFPGTVEVIGEREPAALPAFFRDDVSEAEILAMLGRRPCTVRGLSQGLGLNAHEVAKTLQALLARGKVVEQRIGGAAHFSLLNR